MTALGCVGCWGGRTWGAALPLAPSAGLGCPLLTLGWEIKLKKKYREEMGWFRGEAGVGQLPWDGGAAEGPVGATGRGCPQEGLPLGRGIHGKGCPREGVSMGRGVCGKGCPRKGYPWEGMSMGRDAPGTSLSQGGHVPPVTHRSLSQGRRHTAGVYRDAEDPTAPILQGQALGEHVQRSLGAQPQPGGTSVVARAGGMLAEGEPPPPVPPRSPGSDTLLQR